MTATVFTEAVHPCAPIVSEQEPFLSRSNILIEPNQTIVVGMVLGKTGVVSDETATVSYAAGNTGNGVLTMDGTAPIAGAAIDGQYVIEITTPGATGAFDVMDPTGVVVGTGFVGTTFNGPIKFLLATGGTNFAVDDRIFVQVLRHVGVDDQWAPLNLSATDGTQIAAGIALYPVVTPASGQPNRITAIVRNAEMRAADLTWPTGATAAQIAEATNQLLKQNIVLR
jgi:hypothetical protein